MGAVAKKTMTAKKTAGAAKKESMTMVPAKKGSKAGKA